MSCHRIDELLELLNSHWQKTPDLNLIEFITQITQEAGFDQPLAELTDDVLIYQLKMRGTDKNEMIPGLAKDQEDDFKTALLKARGLL